MSTRADRTAEQVCHILLRDTSFVGWQLVVMGAICVPESGRNFYATNVVEARDDETGEPLPWDRSMDGGGWQINSYWWERIFGATSPNEYLAMVFTPASNAKAAEKIWQLGLLDGLNKGMSYTDAVEHAYSRWTTYRNGLHLPYIDEARAAYETLTARPRWAHRRDRVMA